MRPAAAAAVPPDRAVRVAYDVTSLGYSFGRPGTATGIPRVVHSVARELSLRDDCDLRFCSSQLHTLAGASAYLRADAVLGRRPLLGVEQLSRPLGLLTRTQRRLEGAGGSLPAKVARRANLGALGLLARTQPPVLRRHLRDVDVFHSPLLGFPPAVLREPLVRRVLTVYDLIPLLHPEFFEFRGEHFLAPIIRAIRPDDWVVAISESTRADLLQVRPELDPARVRVTPLAADPATFHPVDDPAARAAARARYGIPEGPYLLSLNTLEPRKNLDRLVRAFARVVQQERVPGLSLVLVGARGWKTEALFRAIDEAGPIRDRVVVAGFVDDADLAALYSGATAFVYPSLYEGFGLPPLEAMQCGTPVVASNTSSLPEVVGDAGLMVDPRDVEAIAGALLRVCGDEALRARMSAASLARAAGFTWSRTADLTLEAYRAAIAAG